ncbi:hypothetical protein WJX72_003131 [[Myrmecia] bisecta]|uniref:F-box domain-containing protein n=1 Tax=[Myrmecia] bisecta TaxID=41462 RepID=A0AAW1P660_9CHLO
MSSALAGSPTDASCDWLQLPTDVAVAILLHLPKVKDIMSLATTCRFWRQLTCTPHVWRSVVKARFPSTDPNKLTGGVQQLQQLYFDLTSPYKAVKDMSVIWLNGTYLRVVDDPNSRSKRVVELRSVCWLDIRHTFQGVLPGVYEVNFCMRFLGHSHDLCFSELAFRCTPSEGCGTAVVTRCQEGFWQAAARFSLRASPVTNYVEISVGVVTMTRVGELTVILEDHSAWWKQGIVFDYVRLKERPPGAPEHTSQPGFDIVDGVLQCHEGVESDWS